MSSSIYLAVPLMIVLAIIQAAVLPHFPALVLMPQMPFLFSLSRGLLRGINEGLLWAFIAGISLDLFSAGPLGLTSLSLMAAILIVIWIGRVLPPNRLLLPVLLSGLATIIWQLLYLLLLQLFGHAISSQAFTSMPRLALLHSGLILPVFWLMLTIDKLVRPRQVQMV